MGVQGTPAFPVAKSDQEWRAELTPTEFAMLRKQGTEPPGTGEYHEFFPKKGCARAVVITAQPPQV